MNQLASKANICSVIVVSGVGFTTHICWGITTLASQGEWGKAAFAVGFFLFTWVRLIRVCVRIPTGSQTSFEASMPLLFRSILPFCIPSAVTLAMMAAAGSMNLTSLFTMISGTAICILVPVTIRTFLWIHLWREGLKGESISQ